MNGELDDQLSAAAARLHAAAERLEVPDLSARELPKRSPRTTLLVAAAVCMVVAGLGAAAMLGDEGGDMRAVTSGPAATSATSAPATISRSSRPEAATATTSTVAAPATSTTSTTGSATVPTTPVAPAVPAEQVLADYLADNPDVVVATPTLDVGGAAVALVGRNADAGAAVAVLDLTSGAASTIAQLSAPGQRFNAATPVQIDDVTGDGNDDVLLPLEAASAGIGMVASNENGRWHLVGADPGDGATAADVVFAREPRFEGGRLVTTDNDCVPSCASGTQTDVAWVYVRAADVFRKAAA